VDKAAEPKAKESAPKVAKKETSADNGSQQQDSPKVTEASQTSDASEK
jgi:hypothetical protein